MRTYIAVRDLMEFLATINPGLTEAEYYAPGKEKETYFTEKLTEIEQWVINRAMRPRLLFSSRAGHGMVDIHWELEERNG